jgi:putative spermidine/putrescine transport system permease protein
VSAPDHESSWRPWLLVAPALLLYLATFVLPLAVVGGASLERAVGGVVQPGPSLDNFRDFLADGVALPAFTRTVYLAAAISLACLLLGYPLALSMRRAGPRLRLVLLLLVVSPLLTSVIVRNVAWILILGREGLVNATLIALGLIGEPLRLMYNDVGVVIGVVHVYLAFVAIPVFASLLAIDASTEESAASLGAPPLGVFWHVTLPLSLPGAIAGTTLVFVLSIGVYLTPVIMGGNFSVTISMIIADLVRTQFDMGRASAFSVVVLAAVGLVLWLSRRLERARRS